jgi:hypothetical protein
MPPAARCGVNKMAARGAGAATKGFGCVGKGPKNHMVSETSMKTGPVMMNKGGMAVKGYKKGGMPKKKVKKMRYGGSCG